MIYLILPKSPKQCCVLSTVISSSGAYQGKVFFSRPSKRARDDCVRLYEQVSSFFLIFLQVGNESGTAEEGTERDGGGLLGTASSIGGGGGANSAGGGCDLGGDVAGGGVDGGGDAGGG